MPFVHVHCQEYLAHCKNLFQTNSEDEYKKLLDEYNKQWDVSFTEHYMKSVHPVVNLSVGKWVLQELGVYNPYSGITSNQSEGLNRVIKDLQSWKEAPADSMILSLHELQAYYFNEVQRGFAGSLCN
jgi:hypothetical protein